MKQNLYTIREVINLTGISEFMLRAWESRYKALTPERTVTARRLYSKQEILRARLLFELTKTNHRIGDIANLSMQELQALSQGPHAQIKSSKHPDSEISKVIKMIYQGKWDDIQQLLVSKRKQLKLTDFIQQIIAPLLAQIGSEVAEKRLSISDEHIFSSFIKENLYALRSQGKVKKNNTRLIIATPEGDDHEIGILIASVIAAHAGVRVLYLGPNLPVRELCEASIKFKATHVLIASTVSKNEGAATDLLGVIHFMDQHLPEKVTLFLAGRQTEKLRLGIKRKHTIFRTIEEFNVALNCGTNRALKR